MENFIFRIFVVFLLVIAPLGLVSSKENYYINKSENLSIGDFESVVYVFSVATCGAMEGLVSMEEAKKIAISKLNNEYRIPNWRIENILKLRSFKQMMNYLVVDKYGGCKSFLKEAGINPSY